MKTRISSRNFVFACLIALVLIPNAGCKDDPVAPCDFVPITENPLFADTLERRFTVGESATVTVNDFVGKVSYRTGAPGVVRVVATRRAGTPFALDWVEVNMVASGNEINIRADNPMNLKKASVDFEITAPADAIPLLATGVGWIDYKGRPVGNCSFQAGTGSIKLGLRSDVSIAVDLVAVVGAIFLDFPVNSAVSNLPSVVRGKIGRGDEGYLHAGTAVGNIYVTRW